jgi:hypothetical protein
MRFNLVYNNSGDTIEFETKYNSELIHWFIEQANQKNYNNFLVSNTIANQIDKRISHCHWALSKTNEVLYDLIGVAFPENTNLLDYLNQDFLNTQHKNWVFSQLKTVDIDKLRLSENKSQAALGWKLHDIYPDEIRHPIIAEVLTHLGFIYAYEEVNMSVHEIEKLFTHNIEFKSEAKWNIIDNPFKDTFISNNDIVNFSFGYTYVGRQYYDKWHFWDTNLLNDDHYNYETLEWAFQVNLDRPQTIPYSREFLQWCEDKNVPAITEQIPIANIVNLEDNLHNYRRILYQNAKQNNHCFLEII